VPSFIGTNNANYYNGGYTDPTNRLTPVGAFAGSPGPYGTYDMGGDVSQWSEANLDGEYRGLRGGNWDHDDGLPASYRRHYNPTGEDDVIGFRVASVPEPGSITLVVCGGLCLFAYAWRRRKGAG
jgi:formylglycine-generating enzyme required for sulfatase activity